MKFTCDREALVDRLVILARGVSSRGTLPVLSGVLLQAQEGRVEMYSTDLEISMKAGVAAQVEQPGDVVVPARLFSDVVRNLPVDDVVVELGQSDEMGGRVIVTGGPARFELNAWAASDFPQTSTFDLSQSFAVARGPFLETLGKVARAASRDDNRPILTGVLVSIDGGMLRMVATDSYRLAVKQTALEGGPETEVQAIVPVKALNEVGRLATNIDSESIALVVGENQALFGLGDLVIATRLIEGQFPNYRQLLPDSFEHVVTLDREPFLGVVRRVGLLAQKNAPLRLKFSPGGQDESGAELPSLLTVRAVTQDIGQAQESLPVEFAGEELEIGFNHLFLIDGVESVEGDKVSLQLITPLRPGLLSAGTDAEDFLYLIMPIRLSG
jgi:DNA polymerase III subunit beta